MTMPTRQKAISPSRAADFARCPLLYRLRVIDRLPEPPSLAAARGTLVHAVLEALFAAPRPERTREAAHVLLEPQWATLAASRPELVPLVEADPGVTAWLDSARALLDTYFGLEDPTRLEPEGTELAVQTTLPSGLLLRGIIDRLDAAPNGALRVVDYKTGRSPAPGYESQVLFQLTFYADVLYRNRGVVPAELLVVYLGNGRMFRFRPSESDLDGFEADILATWKQIEECAATGQFPTRRSKLCGWCAFQEFCPEFEGTPPPWQPTLFV